MPCHNEQKELIFSTNYASNKEYQDANDLLKKLLNKNLEERLIKYKEIKKHPFFSKIKFKNYAQKKILPPLKLSLNNENPTKYFGKVEEKKEEKEEDNVGSNYIESEDDDSDDDLSYGKDIEEDYYSNFLYSTKSIKIKSKTKKK